MSAVGKKIVLIFCCVMACSAIFAGYAHAESDGGGSFGDEIVYGPTIYNVAQNQYYVIVNAPNSYNAALTALGYDPYSSKFTDSVKAYLSDRSTGGSFWEFAQLFTSEEPLNDSLSLNHIYFASAFHAAIDLFGQGYVFGAIYSQDLADGAKERVEAILSGDVGGSGGDDGGGYDGDFVAPDTVTFTMQDYVGTTGTNQVYSQFYVNPRPNPYLQPLNAEFTITLGDAVKQRLNATGTAYKYVTYVLWRNGPVYENQLMVFEVYLTDNPIVVNAGVDFGFTGRSFKIQNDTQPVYDNGQNNLGLVTDRNPSYGNNDTYTYTFDISQRPCYVVTSANPVEPPNNWPDDPPVVAPSPPELPTPHDPVIPNPPTDPTPPQPPTYITQPVYVTNTFTVDLQGILDALDEHCQHLQNALYSNLKSLNDNVIAKLGDEGSTTRSLISERFNWLGMVLGECFETLDDDIYDYFHWLAAQFDFQSGSGYNDNTVVAWLKRIYARLGKGPVNTRPVDPVADPFGFDDWLNELWKQFIMFLQNLLGGALSPVAVAISALADNFPFCLPWDMMAMLGLLVAPPVAPNFDIPIYYLTDSGVQSSMQHVDLSPWTPYLGPLQLLFTILFVKQLIHLTPKVMNFFNAAGGE